MPRRFRHHGFACTVTPPRIRLRHEDFAAMARSDGFADIDMTPRLRHLGIVDTSMPPRSCRDGLAATALLPRLRQHGFTTTGMPRRLRHHGHATTMISSPQPGLHGFGFATTTMPPGLGSATSDSTPQGLGFAPPQLGHHRHAALAERASLRRSSRLLGPTSEMVGALSGAACPRQVSGRPKKSRCLALMVQCGHFCARENWLHYR